MNIFKNLLKYSHPVAEEISNSNHVKDYIIIGVAMVGYCYYYYC